MQIERIIGGVTTLGPGQRLCVWVNGCNKRCKGCVSLELQSFRPENETDAIALFAKFRPNASTAVTISGGEPFEQVVELAALLKYLHGCGVTDILVYTGYTLEELLARKEHAEQTRTALKYIGVLIDGPYMEELNRNVGNLKGSENQRVIFINEGLRPKYEAYERAERKMQEFYILPHIVGVGIPTKEYIENFRKGE